MKRFLSLVLVIVIMLNFASCFKSEAAKSVDEQIESIGKVTLESKEKIESAQKAVDKLSAEDKEQLDNLTVLEEAKNTYTELRAKYVDDLILEIGNTSDLTVKSKDKFKAVDEAYNDLTDDEKAKVNNYSKYEELQNEYNKIKKEYKEKEIKKLTANFDIKYDEIAQLTTYTHKNEPKYIDERSYIIPYIRYNETLDFPWLYTRYNYTGDDWIFYTSVTVKADDEYFSSKFNYSDVVRGNDYGVVWEVMDDYPTDTNMLKSISNSKNATVRFNGNDYHYDLVVSQTDKNIIKDVLKLYEVLSY